MKKTDKKLKNFCKKNHNLLMTICCVMPLILIIILYIIGIDNKYIFWLLLITCPLMHYFMMKDMNHDHTNK